MDSQVEEFRKEAEHCRKLATTARASFEVRQLLELAERWDAFANERKEMFGAQAKLRDI